MGTERVSGSLNFVSASSVTSVIGGISRPKAAYSSEVMAAPQWTISATRSCKWLGHPTRSSGKSRGFAMRSLMSDTKSSSQTLSITSAMTYMEELGW